MTNIKTKNFHANLSVDGDKAYVKQQILNPTINTAQLPATVDLLYAEVPSIFANDCINYQSKPFYEEVKETEIGHLFEHLMLEYIKIETENSNKIVDIKGETSWDWNCEPFGTFNIEIDFSENIDAIKKAFYKASLFLEKLYKLSSD